MSESQLVYFSVSTCLVFLLEKKPAEIFSIRLLELSSFVLVYMQFLGVNNGAVELDSSIMGIQQEGKKIKVPLNSRYSYIFSFARLLYFQLALLVDVILIFYFMNISVFCNDQVLFLPVPV